ncbi:hypothetical protein [Streptomyces sp. SYSU K217416]
MAEDDGTGRPVYGTATPSAPSSMDSLWSVNPQQAMLVEADTLKTFQKRVDGVLAKLIGSEASPGKLADEQMMRTQLGGGERVFAEADALFDAYGNVVEQLKKLSKMLSDSIEGLSIAVHASQAGYENIDEDIRRRMLSLNENTRDWAEEHAKDQDKTGETSDRAQL